LIRKNPQSLADEVIKVLKDKTLYQKITKAARLLIEKKYSYQAVAKILDKIYQEVSHVKRN
jgi:glycosyltransferase involved in cell wall biosynthesis